MGAAFIQNHIGEAGIVTGHKAGEPRQALVFPFRSPLGRAGFAGDAGIGQAGAAARTAFNHLPHALAHAGQGTFIGRQGALDLLGLGSVNDIGVAVLNLLDELEPGQVAVRHAGHHVRHLEGRDQQRSLADGKVGGVSGHEIPLVVADHVVAGGHQAGIVRNGQPGALAKSEGAGRIHQGFRSQLEPHLVHERVVGHRQGADAVDVPQGRLAPVVENVVADRDGCRAVDLRIFRDLVVFQGAGHRQHLEGGGGGVAPLEGACAQRSGGVVAQGIVILLGYVRNEHVRVIGRRGGHYQHFTRYAVQHHHGAAPLAAGKDAFRIPLPFQVQGGDDGAAGLGAYLKFIQNLVAVLVKHQAPYAGRPSQVLVEFLFQSRAAFHLFPQRVHMVDGAGRQFSLGTHIADDMSGDFLFRIGTDVDGQQLEAAHPLHLVPQFFRFLRADDVGKGKRQPAAVLIVLPELVIGKGPRFSSNFLSLFQAVAPEVHYAGTVGIFKNFKPQGQLVGHGGHGQRLSVAVQNGTARSRNQQGHGSGGRPRAGVRFPRRIHPSPLEGGNQGQGIQAVLLLLRFLGHFRGVSHAFPFTGRRAGFPLLIPQVNRFHGVIFSTLLRRSLAHGRSPAGRRMA